MLARLFVSGLFVPAAVLGWIVLAPSAVWNGPLAAATIVSRDQAARLGLERLWFAQVDVDSSRSQVVDALIDGDGVFVETDEPMVHALDGRTGRTVWSVEAAAAGRPVESIDADSRHVAFAAGSLVTVVRRGDGRLVWQHRLANIPGTGPALVGDHVYVPLLKGPMESFQLPLEANASQPAENPLKAQTPWNLPSTGRTLAPPIATATRVSWATDRGLTYFIDRQTRRALYRLQLDDVFASRLTVGTDLVLATSLGGYVYAIEPESGRLVWRTSVGQPLRDSPLVTRERIFVWSSQQGLVCLDAAQGTIVWRQPRIRRLASVSPTRAYGLDGMGRLLASDVRSGVIEATLAIGASDLKLVNRQTDRIFVGTTCGLIQCFGELELDTPVRHFPPAAESAAAAAAEPRPAGVVAGDAEDPDAEQPLPEPVDMDQPAADVAAPEESGGGEAAGEPEVEPAADGPPAEAPPGQEPQEPDPFGEAG